MSKVDLSSGHVREADSDRVRQAVTKLRSLYTDSELRGIAHRIVTEPPEWLDAYNLAVRLRVLLGASSLRDGLTEALRRLGGTP